MEWEVFREERLSPAQYFGPGSEVRFEKPLGILQLTEAALPHLSA